MTIYLPTHFSDAWEIILKRLTLPILSIEDYQKSIETIGGFLPGTVTFFQHYFDEAKIQRNPTLKAKKESWIKKVIPHMQQLAIRLPDLFPNGVPILCSIKDGKVTLTKEQVSCLLCHGFWGSFDRVVPVGRPLFPEFSIRKLISGHIKDVAPTMECLMHYFERISDKMPNGNLIIRRRKLLSNESNWEISKRPVCNISVYSEGKIEDSPADYHVDFANQFIGGAVLKGGNAQEEILFAIKPECIVSLLICEKMKDNECIILSGAEKFSEYTGYGSEFSWKSPFYDKTPLNQSSKCLNKNVIAIDATYCLMHDSQFTLKVFNRDLNKAYCGFSVISSAENNRIATGNWGTGAFGGDKSLKVFQQILACSESNGNLLYYTFGDEDLEKTINSFISKIKHLTVGELYNLYVGHVDQINHLDKYPVFNVILNNIK